ncbi:MAG: uroporphyrinogen-III C-methyltransferase [Rhodospirillaceae bacterium]|nr:uroporphyrinogen-III C-methyltransferase [Rhodospirillaceae bacterium]
MRHFPLFVDLRGQRVVLSGAGEMAAAKLRLLLKTEAEIAVFGTDPAAEVAGWAEAGRIALATRPIAEGDADGARLLYAVNQDAAEDARAAAIGRGAGALVNILDDLEGSQFIMPAIVDRDPVTVAIGTEGAAPVLARRIKAQVEELLGSGIGVLARIGQGLRGAAQAVLFGDPRRRLWETFYEDVGPAALREGGEEAALAALNRLIADFRSEPRPPGRVTLVGAGPGDPELLTQRARRALHGADVVIYDRLVPGEILELARREAVFVQVGKVPGGPSWPQDEINALMVEHASGGAQVVRLKSGDPGIYGRLEEEMDALDAAGIAFEVVPGVTAAAAAAAAIKVSLTKRHRNSGVRLLTGQDVGGFAELDWHGLARPGAVAAVYMGVRAARFLQGRMMIHGASADMPVTAVENASRPSQKVVATSLGRLGEALAHHGIVGPAILFLGLAPRAALAELEGLPAQAAGGR